MIDKYKVLNNEKIQFNRYSEIKTDNEKMKNIMKSKINSRKKVGRKLLVASISSIIILGCIALNNETACAYISRLVNHIEYFFNKDYGEFDKYKFEGNQSLENDGLILNLGDVMLDDKQLIISLGIDYSNFDLEKHGFNKKTFIPDLPLITIGDMSFPGQGGSITQRNVSGEDKKEVLYMVDLTSIDTNNDGLADKNFEILDNLEKNKDYTMKIQFKDFDIGESKTEPGRWLNKEFGNWEFNTTINSSNISRDMKIIQINKVIDISEGNKKHKLKIEDIRLSPISAKIKMCIEGDISNDSFFSLSVKDENGNNLINSMGSAIHDDQNTAYCDFELKGTEKKLIITPVLFMDGDEKYFEDKKIEIDIP